MLTTTQFKISQYTLEGLSKCSSDDDLDLSVATSSSTSGERSASEARVGDSRGAEAG